MAESAFVDNTTDYPIWIGEDHKLHCDEDTLELHLLQNSNYDLHEAKETVTKLVHILSKGYNTDNPSFWELILYNDGETFFVIVQNIGLQHRIKLLNTTSGKISVVKTLPIAIDPKRNKLLALILDAYSQDECSLLVMIKHVGGIAAIHWACFRANIEAVRIIVSHISQARCYHVMSLGGATGKTALHYAEAFHSNTDLLDVVQTSLTDEQWFNLLELTDSKEMTPLHCAASLGHTESVELMQNTVTEDQWYKLLQKQDDRLSTPLIHAASYSHAEILQGIYCSVDTSQWYHLLTMTDIDRHNAVHNIAYEGSYSLLEMIEKTMAPKEFIKLLSIPFSYINRITYQRYENAIKLLEDVKLRVRIKIVVSSSTDKSGEL